MSRRYERRSAPSKVPNPSAAEITLRFAFRRMTTVPTGSGLDLRR
jgi:hypothetical protein